MAATARPWLTDPDCGDEHVVDVDGKLIADCAIFGHGFEEERNQDNAALIVRAVNCHDELLAALKEVVDISDRKHDAWDKAKAAIAKAERSGAA